MSLHLESVTSLLALQHTGASFKISGRPDTEQPPNWSSRCTGIGMMPEETKNRRRVDRVGLASKFESCQGRRRAFVVA